MKWPRLHLSAHQTAAVSIAGALIASCCFLAARLLRESVRVHQHLGWSMAAVLVPMIAGFAISLYAEADLKKGIAAERWPEQDVDSLRRILTSRWTTTLSLLCLLVFFLLTLLGLFSNHPHSDYSTIGWAFYAPGMSAIWLRNAVSTPKTENASRPLIDWRSDQPIQSDHWGQR